jgi:diguanylate cyclase (GGDEF)-like protein
MSPDDRALLLKRLDDHRSFSATIAFLAGTVFAALWIWDYVIDPIGAHDTWRLRLLFMPAFYAYGLYVLRATDPTRAFLAGLAATWLALLTFMEIIDRLHSGMTYGIAGFMYAGMLGVVGFHAFSLRLNWIYTVTTALLPHLLAWLGFASGFQHLKYAVLLWPAAVMAGIAQYVVDKNYRQRHALEQSLQRASNTDALTGVSNRRYFFPRMEQEMMRSRRTLRPLALIVADIDHFKRVNDAYGHPVGDQVIRMLAQKCLSIVRETDVVARLGGEEFGILLPETDLAGAVKLAERLRTIVAESDDGAGAVHFTVSLGVDQMRSGDRLPGDIFQRADAALYQAKQRGRNRVESAADTPDPPFSAAR